FLGGQTSFFKITTDHRYYRQLGGEVVLASAIRLGFEEGLRGNRAREIISFERFRAGGSTTVRGYKERSLGPVDESGNHRGDVLLILNTELRFPIYKFIGGVLFFDVGNVWDKLSAIDESPLYSAVGLGVRVDTPLGPARLDFGIPFRKGFDDFDAPSRRRFEALVYLELGHAF
ncbi:MAG: BamA/TamA family outer membrane protein, partial [Candidatus Poribacteria bacterium]|nr:BamA/TamA family outer membrane protein [Candidatus Poribacteria bacterium]